MMKISIWARHHKWPARFLMAGGSLLLICLGSITGVLLRDIQFIFSPLAMIGFAIMTIVAFIYYPGKHLKQKMSNPSLFFIVYYFRQKVCDFILLFSTFCTMAYISNRQEILFNSWQAKAAVIGSTVSNESKPYQSISEFSKMMRDKNGKLLKWKERRKLLKQQVRAIRQSDNPKGEKIFLMILAITVAVGLSLFMAGLACALACNGSGALAVLVLVAGVALISFLLSYTIKKILGKKKEPEEKNATPLNGS